MSGLEAFKQELEPVERAVLTEWAKAAQRTNYRSLQAGQGPDGPTLTPNKERTIKRKKHDRVGIDSGKMLLGLLADEGIEVDTSGGKGKARVFGGDGSTDFKLGVFVGGQSDRSGEKIWVSEMTKSGKLKTYQVPKKAVPPRDFFGLAQADLDAAAENAAESVLRSWGFR